MTDELFQWCCGTFRRKFMEAGQPGVAIFPYLDKTGRVRWILQHRVAAVEAPDGTLPEIWAVQEEPIGYCPFCGKDLYSSYRDTEPLLRTELAIGAQAPTPTSGPNGPPAPEAWMQPRR